MSGCEYYQDLISRMPDEELSGEEKTALAEHLKACPDCTLLYSAFAGLSEIIKEDMLEAPESIRINVMAEIRREEIRKKNAVRRKRLLRMAAAAACLVLVVSVGFAARPGLKKENAVLAETPMKFAAPAAAAPAAGEPEAYVEEAVPEEAAAKEAVPEEPAEAESGFAAANEELAVSQSRFTMYSADSSAKQLPVWEELSAVLQGVEAEIDIAEISLDDRFFISFILDGKVMELEFMVCEDSVFYTDPVNGLVKRLGCGLDELSVFVT